MSSSSANVNNTLLGFLVIILSFLGLPATVKAISFAVLGFFIIIFALASSNLGQHGQNQIEKH